MLVLGRVLEFAPALNHVYNVITDGIMYVIVIPRLLPKKCVYTIKSSLYKHFILLV